jgi:protein TonB
VREGRWTLEGISDFAMTYWKPEDSRVATPFPPRPPRAVAAAEDGFESEDPWDHVTKYVSDWSSPCLGRASQAPAVDPVPVTTVQPNYPEFAREAQIQGRVKLIVCVDETGRVGSVKVAEGVTGLTEAAIHAVKQWIFKPAQDGYGNPVSALIMIPVDFHI